MARKMTVNIDTIKETFFVRKELKDDHVLALAELYEAGVELPRLLVTEPDGEGFFELIDGRHRLHALQFLEKKAVNIVTESESNRGKLIAMALKANLGGSMPPTRDDITYSIRAMMEAGMTKSEISKTLPFPPSLVRKYLNSVETGISRDKLQRAVRDVAERGLSIPEAARAHNADPESVKAVILGNRRKRTGLAEIKGGLTNAYRGRSKSLASIFGKLLRAYEDGDMTGAKVAEVFEHVDSLHKNAATTIRNWEKRWEKLKEQKDA